MFVCLYVTGKVCWVSAGHSGTRSYDVRTCISAWWTSLWPRSFCRLWTTESLAVLTFCSRVCQVSIENPAKGIPLSTWQHQPAQPHRHVRHQNCKPSKNKWRQAATSSDAIKSSVNSIIVWLFNRILWEGQWWFRWENLILLHLPLSCFCFYNSSLIKKKTKKDCY